MTVPKRPLFPSFGRLALALALLLAMAPAPAAATATSPVHAVVLDRLESVGPADFRFEPCPDTASFVVLDDGFTFQEQQPGSGASGGTPYPGGYLSLGCGEALLDREVPPGARLVEVRFLGDRGVDEFDVEGSSLTRPGREFSQEVAFRTADGAGDRRVAYLDAQDGSQPLQERAVDGFQVPEGTPHYTLAWSFRDASYFVGPGFPDVLSGQAFNATVRGVELRYPGIVLGADVGSDLQRAGDLLVRQTSVALDVADPAAGDVRIEVASGLAFDHLRGPDGQRVTVQSSRTGPGPDGFDRSGILVEALPDGAVQVTVPREMLSSLGPGRYTVAFTGVDAVQTYPWVLPLALLVLLAPLPFALLAYRHVRRFEDESFGGFRRSARNLRIALVVAFAYYVIVLASHFLGARLDLLTAWPLPVEAVLVYVQVAIAVAAFLALYAVARELYHITVPKPLAPAARPTPLPEDAE